MNLFNVILMIVMFVLGCIAMRRWMNEHKAAMPSYDGLHPTDEQLLAWAEELTGLFVDCRDRGYGIAWDNHVAYFYKVFDGRTVVYGTWDYENGMRAVEHPKYSKTKPHPNQNRALYSNGYQQQPPYPPEFAHNQPIDW